MLVRVLLISVPDDEVEMDMDGISESEVGGVHDSTRIAGGSRFCLLREGWEVSVVDALASSMTPRVRAIT